MPAIASTQMLKELMKEYFVSFFPEEGPKPKVAWCTSVGPAELLIALGFKVYYPENHGALLGATRAAEKYIPIANASGYSPEICSYLTADIGAYECGETPLTKAYGIPSIPKPDVLIYNTNQCREVQDWFAYYAKKFNVPSLGIFSPWKVDTVSTDQTTCVAEQFKGLVPKLEAISGTKLDIDRLRETVNHSKKTTELWLSFLESARTRPSPITFFDACIQMAPAVVLRGLPAANDYYRTLNDEIQTRIAAGTSAIANEQIRIYWEGMPVWGRLRYFSDLFARLNTTVVASTYCDSWVFSDFDGNDPFTSMATAYTKIFINRSEDQKEIILKEMAEVYAIDGFLFHDAKTCPYNSNSRFGMPKRLQEQCGIPSLIIDGDVNDLRCFSDEQTVTAAESFISQIEELRS